MTYYEHGLWRLYDAGASLAVLAVIVVLIWVALTDRYR